MSEFCYCSMRSGGAHGRYGVGDWTFLKCRQHMATASTIFFSFAKIANFVQLYFDVKSCLALLLRIKVVVPPKRRDKYVVSQYEGTLLIEGIVVKLSLINI